MDSKKCEQLWEAATKGNLPLVEQLSKDREVNLNWQDPEAQRTPFYRACGHGRIETVKFMLRLKELEVNLPQNQGATPLLIACSDGHVEIVSLLLGDQRVEINQANLNGVTSLYIGCSQGHVEIVSTLLADPRIEINKAEEDDLTPFYVACQNGHVGVVSLLLADGRADFNKARNTGATPFLIACEAGQVGVVSELLADQRIDINQPNKEDLSPLWMATYNGRFLVVQHLLASGREEIDTKKSSIVYHTTAAEQGRRQGSRTTKYENESHEDFQRSTTNGLKIADLIESFEKDPRKVRAQLRKELNGLPFFFISPSFPFSLALLLSILEPLGGELFALVIYLSDGYLTIPRSQCGSIKEKSQKAQKFFSLAVRLPLDLQMVLCNRAFGLADSIIKRVHSERGFRTFANEGLW